MLVILTHLNIDRLKDIASETVIFNQKTCIVVFKLDFQDLTLTLNGKLVQLFCLTTSLVPHIQTRSQLIIKSLPDSFQGNEVH